MIKFKTHYGRQIVTVGSTMRCFDTVQEAWQFIFKVRKNGGKKYGI